MSKADKSPLVSVVIIGKNEQSNIEKCILSIFNQTYPNFEVVYVDDLQCVIGCRRLLQVEAILAGGSSGGSVMAVDRLRKQLPSGSRCVIIISDRGERYLDTVYSDAWVKAKFGCVEHLLA